MNRTTTLIFAILLAVGFVLWDLGVGCESRSILWPTIDTRFAPGFSERAFAKVAIGMSEEEVRRLLGPPLGISRYSHYPTMATWCYSGDGACPWGDFAWTYHAVTFREGKVAEITRRWYYD